MTADVLSLVPAGIEAIDTSNIDSIREMWSAFKGAKNLLKCGPRLEYLSWRLYSREILAMKNRNNLQLPHIPNSDLSALLNEHELDINDTPAPAQSELAANAYKSYGNSNAVHGFSPSHVSVARRETPVSSDSSSTSSRGQDPSSAITEWHQAPVGPKGNMFFIDSGSESDTDSIQESVAPRDVLRPASEDNEIEEVDVSDNDNDDDDESGSWDDTEEEENAEDVAEREKQREEQLRKNLFREKAVPLKPLLKPSLLSNLFLNKQNIAAQRDEEAEKSRLLAQKSQREDPSEVMLGAAVPRHIPINTGSPAPADEHLSRSLRDALKQSNEKLWPIRDVNRSRKNSIVEATPSSEVIGAPIMSWRKPDLSRSSRDTSNNQGPGARGTRGDLASPTTESWVNQHEDIYDPLNYHSRGW